MSVWFVHMVCVSAYMCVCACMRACVRARACVCLHICECACMRDYVPRLFKSRAISGWSQ